MISHSSRSPLAAVYGGKSGDREAIQKLLQ